MQQHLRTSKSSNVPLKPTCLIYTENETKCFHPEKSVNVAIPKIKI